MKITGYKLQHALRELTHTRDIAVKQFNDGLMAFEGEDKPTPQKAMEHFEKSEEDIASLQVAQTLYNIAVKVKVLGKDMTLCGAIKRVGGAGRMEKMWRVAAGGDSKRERYGSRYDETRDPNVLVARKQVSVEVAVEMAKKTAKYASALREAIQIGNATEVDVEGLSPALFE